MGDHTETLRGDEIEFQIAFQCAPLITGLKESNLLNIGTMEYPRMKEVFKDSELSVYPLGIHAGRITVFFVSSGSSGSIFFQRKRAGIVA